jgi:DNA repair protein RadD
MSLRDYQVNLKNKTHEAWASGHKNVLNVLPCGGGKTKTMATLAAELDEPGVIQAHREELVTQIAQALAREGVPHRIIGPEKVAREAMEAQIDELGRSWVRPDAAYGVASTDTLIRRQDPWFDQVKHWQTDEAHHLLSTNKWGRAVGLLINAKRGIGWTATPCRLDRKSLRRGEGGMFDVMNIGPGMRELINRGYLKDYRIYGLPQSMDISNVRTTSGGEFNQADLHDAAAKSTITGDIVKHAIALAPGKRGVTFAIDVPMATEHAQGFRDAGVKAAVLSSYTPAGERAQIIRAYRGDSLQEVVNVDVLGEGFDLPGIVRASFARPTQSLGLYIQQFGRPLRPCEGEGWGIICDHVGNVPRHGLPDKPRQWSLDAPPPREKGEIPVRVCGNPECMRDYEGFSRVCPHCGWQPIYGPAERQRPEVLEGDLTLYAPELLAALRAEVERIAGPADIPYGASPKIAAAVEKRWRERGAAQSDLAGVIDLWAGQWHHGRGEALDAVYRRFWATFGMDTYTALSMSGPKQRELIERVRADI